MLCSILFASWICFQPAPIICQKYEKAIFTAYTLSQDETDGDPNIGAGNHNLKSMCSEKRCCASRLYPLHTKINIKGIGTCEILDRTSIKYGKRIDILNGGIVNQDQLSNKWKGGISSVNDKIRKSEKYNQWRLFVYKKYNWTCQLCKIKCQSGNIVAHHIKGFSEFPRLRFKKYNGIVYCRSCHRKLHAELNKFLCQK